LKKASLRRVFRHARLATARKRGNDIFPRLAGQHADYLVKQVLVIQSTLRAAPVMHDVIKDLSPDQMRAVATYLESLSP
jgi:cytochrome c553